MSNETSLKIIVLGPISSGKTAISNFLSDSTENVNNENRPTQGVRILEFVAEGLKVKDRHPFKADVELWDCGGDDKYENCWPAILNKADGIIFVYNQNNSKQRKHLETLYKYFVTDVKFSNKNCVLLFNSYGNEGNEKPSSPPLPKTNHFSVNIEENGTELRKTFNAFLSAIVSSNINK